MIIPGLNEDLMGSAKEDEQGILKKLRVKISFEEKEELKALMATGFHKVYDKRPRDNEQNF